MKVFLIPLFTLCALLSPVRADVPVPRPNRVTVTNLNSFPKYKFSYVVNDEKKGAKPLVDGKAFESLGNVELFVQSGGDAPQPWAKITYVWQGQKVALTVHDVRQQGKTITVLYKTLDGAVSPVDKSASNTGASLPLFLLAGLGTCGLVLLRRRRS